MPGKVYHIVLLLFVLIITFSCSKNKNESSKETIDLTSQLQYANNIKDFINEVKVQEIDLDKLKQDTLKPVQVIGDSENQKLFIGEAWDCTVENDSIYIVDPKTKSIIVADSEGKLIRKIGREGKGPGEFQRPVSITSNGNYFAVYDTDEWTVSIFDKHFHFLKKVESSTRSFTRSIGMDKHYLYCKTFFFRKEANIDIFSLEGKSSGKLIESVRFPLIAKPKTRAVALNGSTFAVNDSGYIFYAYVGLPYLFVYNPKHEHIASIKFKANFIIEDLRSIKIPKNSSHMFILKNLIQSVDAYGNQVYMLFSKKKLIVATLNDNNTLTDIKFYYLESNVEKNWITAIKVRDKEIYTGSFNNPLLLKYSIK